ncbi:MAG: PKD domain-containing protein [Flavipsychrobacter sp.]
MMLRWLIYSIVFFSPLISLAQGPNASLEFIKNEGQWDGPFKYKSTTGNVSVFLEPTSFVYILGATQNADILRDYKHGRIKEAPVLNFHRYEVKMLGANSEAEITGTKPQNHYYNYFLGNDSTKWKSNIHPNLAVDYANIYQNIDLHIASANTKIKYDFIVKPNGKPNDIKLEIKGADDIRVKNGKLIITTSVGTVEEQEPYAYQYSDGVLKEISCKYKLKDNIITYHFPKGYDGTQNLIIDPTVVFSTYTGSTADNWGFTATYDNQGNFYAGGAVDATLNGAYITTNGAFQVNFQGGGTGGGNDTSFRCDMAITKFNATGSALIYSTYIGGNNNDQPHSMIVDRSGNLIIAGRTYSNNFPTIGAPYDNSYNLGADIVVVKLNAAGSALAASTYVGGSGDDGVNISSVYATVNSSLKHSYGDEARSEVVIDAQGNVYVAACTRSTNFPTANAIQTNLLGQQDAVVFKLDPNLSNLLWSTYLGGNADDAAYVLALNKSESHIYVSGGTAGNNFPFSPGTLWGSYQGGIADGFIAKFQNSGSYPLDRATAIGRGSYDQCYGIQVDDDNNVYTMGQTLGGTFPVTAGVFSVPNSSQFVIKLDSNLSTNIYSTVFGSGSSSITNITPVAFLVDTCQNVYISGWGSSTLVTGNPTNSSNMPIPASNPATTPNNILKSTSQNGDDFYFIVLSRNATAQLFGGYYGLANLGDHVDGGTSRFDENGIIYQAICGGCGNIDSMPTTTGAWSNTNNSNNCNLVALKIAFNLGSVSAAASANPSTTVCVGEQVQFTNNSANATIYSWNFGDGSPLSTATSPSHSYTTPGTYTVKLIARNPNACYTIDSTTLTIVVDTNSINADFNTVVTDSCGPYIVNITNNSKFGNNPSAATLTWDFGDGTSFTGNNPSTHNYNQKGTYTIRLIMSDPTSCNKVDSVSKTVNFNNILVKANMEAPDLICQHKAAKFSNTSENATSYNWDFGDGNNSSDPTPSHIYDSVGTYTITFYASNPLSCNKVDTFTKTITVSVLPTADFIHAPIIPVTNEPVVFTNRSLKADTYNWNFGDGTGSQDETPQPHYYKRTGNYTVCLTASTLKGCSDTICKKVDADIFPLADIPTAFTPNGDGNNDILLVRGSGIETVNLRIFNRWGELVFETNEESVGWDGNYKNKEQPTDAYAFVLNVSFVDGTTLYKKGNVTLIR